jgi:acetoin utilization deacetylase AcuC-like enzyme
VLKIFYSDTFVLPLPDGHRFPMAKYQRLRERLIAHPDLGDAEFLVPDAVSYRALARVHTTTYLDQLRNGQLPREIERRIGFPWSPGMVERSRRSVGATMGAAEAALQHGVAVNLAGGTHHAFADRGGGYCVLNDTVVAARWLQARGLARRVLVVDLDVHQGDGTAALCAEDPSIFTLSIHGERNYPARKWNWLMARRMTAIWRPWARVLPRPCSGPTPILPSFLPEPIRLKAIVWDACP